MSNIQQIKMDIVRKYGAKPTIGYYYYSLNPVEYVGEEQVRKSFDSVKQHGKNIIIGDYSSTDNIKEIVDEYDFTFLTIEKTPKIFFHESKIANKIIKESPQNFLCYLNFWITYPDNFSDFLLKWLRENHGQRFYLKVTGYAINSRGQRFKTNPKAASHSVSTLLYRPYLLEARGYDETTSYTAGVRNYAVGLMQSVFKLEPSYHFLDFIHIRHTNKHWDKVSNQERKKGHGIVQKRLNNLARNFYNEVRSVKNSYW